MAKTANVYFKTDPWKIVEKGFDPAHNRQCESVFSLSNEYMGVRGYMEESTGCDSLLGSYLNGVYEYADELNRTAYKGIVQRTHYMVTASDWLYLRFSADGESFDMGSSVVTDFSRQLDMRDGSLTRSFVWHRKDGRLLRVTLRRFLGMEDVHFGWQQISFEPIGFSGRMEIRLAVDFSAVHQGSGKCHWRLLDSEAGPELFWAVGETLNTRQKLFSGFGIRANQPYRLKGISEGMLCGCELSLELTQEQPFVLEKYVANLVEKDPDASEVSLRQRGLALLRDQKADFEQALKVNEAHYRAFWDRFDIRIDGDEIRQQGIRFCIFQLHQTYQGKLPMSNIGAKGLTGEAYNGHAFWDTETYCLPFYLFNDTNAAKNLLEFRYATLEQAKDRARELDCKGACYPIATLNGTEACDLWQHASLQFQPSTGVAYGIFHYWRVCGDDEFLFGHGAEMLTEISRFLCSRGSWNGKGNEFGFYAVMGPDEFHMMVAHNCYTNYMAKKTFEFLLEVVDRMRTDNAQALGSLRKKTGLTDAELEEFSRCASCMKILYDDKTGLFEQHQGYYDLPHIDVDEIPQTDFPLYYHWSYDRIYRTDMIKQPDVLMFLFLYGTEFSERVKQANYEYYEPRCIHESSLSPSIHSVIASELGMRKEAYDFFGFATRLDLDNYNQNTAEGLHTTSLAAAWVNIVYGFGGLRSDGEMLRLAPTIPDEWDGYSFRFCYRGAVLCVEVGRSSMTITSLNGREAVLSIYGHRVTVQNAVTLPLEHWLNPKLAKRIVNE